MAVQQASVATCRCSWRMWQTMVFDISKVRTSTCPSTYGGGDASLRRISAFGRTAATNQYFMDSPPTISRCRCSSPSAIPTGLPLLQHSPGARLWATQAVMMAALSFFINSRRNYAPVGFRPHLNFEQSFTYELPFGRGHNIMSSGIGAVVLGGWKISGIISVLSGFRLQSPRMGRI